MSQYTATPAGAQRNMKVKMMGISIIIFCCIGSTPVVGVILCCQTIVAPMSTGVT